jgi:hypothetical protein
MCVLVLVIPTLFVIFYSEIASICHLPWKYFFNFIYNCTTWGVLVNTNCHLLAPVHRTQTPFGECQGLYVKVLKVCRAVLLSVRLCCVYLPVNFSLCRSMFAFLSRFYSFAPFTRQKAQTCRSPSRTRPSISFRGGTRGQTSVRVYGPATRRWWMKIWKQVWQGRHEHYMWTRLITSFLQKNMPVYNELWRACGEGSTWCNSISIHLFRDLGVHLTGFAHLIWFSCMRKVLPKVLESQFYSEWCTESQLCCWILRVTVALLHQSKGIRAPLSAQKYFRSWLAWRYRRVWDVQMGGTFA